MRKFMFLATVLFAAVRTAQAQAVFAHVIVGNNAAYQSSDWEYDISLASSKGIEAFVLNICPPLAGTVSNQVALAFQAVANVSTGFKLFFSFDYLGCGTPWATNDIITLLQQYGSNDFHYKYNGRPFVSTFEGPTNSDVNQWATIRAAIPGDIYFVPDWTSQGPGYRMDLYDGAFSWTMWPDGPTNMTVRPDQAWLSKLTRAKKTYMMGISPWFYTDLPGYQKAWVWRGDSLWYDRWQEALTLKPKFIQLVSWNDYGESHYIGPIRTSGIPSAPNADARPYVEGFPHTAWLETLPYQIAAYKHAVNPAMYPAPVVQAGEDKVVFWYRNTPANSGSPNGVTGNACPSSINTGGYQKCYAISQILEDGIFAIVLLSRPQTVTIAIGDSAPQTFKRLRTGINFISRGFNGQTGVVKVGFSRGGTGVGTILESQPANGILNLNAWVGCMGQCSVVDTG